MAPQLPRRYIRVRDADYCRHRAGSRTGGGYGGNAVLTPGPLVVGHR